MVSQNGGGGKPAADTAAYPPAPVDPRELAQTLRPFGDSRMLPRAAYTDAASSRGSTGAGG